MSYSLLNKSDHKDRSLLVISCAVIGMHGIFLVWALLLNSFAKPPVMPAPRRLVVQTVNLNPQAAQALREVAVVEVLPVAEPLSPEVEDDRPAPLPEIKPEPSIPQILPEPTIQEEAKAKVEPEIPVPSKPLVEKTPPPPAPKVESKPTPKIEPKVEPKVEPKKTEPPKKAPVKKKPVKKPPAKPEKVEKVEKVEKPVVKAKEPAKKEVVKETPPKKPELPKVNKEKLEAEKAAAEKKAVEKVEAEKRLAEVQRKKEAEQQALKVKQQQLISKAQESIAKIGQSRDKVSPSKLADLAIAPVPTAISSLQIDALFSNTGPDLSAREISYRDELAGRLKLLLKLPEYGEVKIKLTLNRSGTVAKVVVVSAESAVNRKHIEKTLPSLTFPGFGDNFDEAEQYTFTVTLSNEL